jgi:hypothetical protein
LIVNGSLAAPLQVAGGATLGGSGTLAGATLAGASAANPATLAPGDQTVATLAASGTVTFGPDSRYLWELGEADDQQRPGHDHLAAAHLALTATAARPLVLVLLPPPDGVLPQAAGVYPVATASGGLTGHTPAAVVVDASRMPLPQAWTLRVADDALELVYSPTSFASWIAGFPGLTDQAAEADPDGDGWSNHDEWVAGTRPDDPASRFAPVPGPAGLTIARAPGRTYRVHTSPDLVAWHEHAVIPAGLGEITVPHPVPAGERRFYQVTIEFTP